MCFLKHSDIKGFRIALDTDLRKRKGVACQGLLELKSKISTKSGPWAIDTDTLGASVSNLVESVTSCQPPTLNSDIFAAS